MKIGFLKYSIFTYASGALLAMSVPVHATNDDDYCESKSNDITFKHEMYKQEYEGEKRENSDSKRKLMQLEARNSLYKKSVNTWTYDCAAMVKCDDDHDDDYCPVVVSPNS